jgi:anti-anti-sigma factor
MELTLSYEDRVLVAQASGFIDETCLELFRDRLHPHLSTRGAKLVVDLSQTTRANSAGLAALVTLTAHANTISSQVIFCAPPPYVRSVLAATKLEGFLNVAPSLAEALLNL